MLFSLFYFPKEYDVVRSYQIKSCLETLSPYVKNKGDPSEILDTVYHHAMEHYDPEKGELIPYLVTLLRSTRTTDTREVHFENQDKVVSDQILRVGSRKDRVFGSTVIVNTDPHISPRVDKFSDVYEQVAEFALGSLPEFIPFCEAVKTRNSTNLHFSPAFKKQARRLYSASEHFLGICLDIYSQYGDAMKEFIEEQPKIAGKEAELWVEAEYKTDRLISRRISLVRPDGSVCSDPDTEPFKIKGSLGDKHLYRVRYREMYDLMEEYIDSLEYNPIKFSIGNSYIFRTLGGSYSVLNLSLFTEYEAVRMEMITNIARDLGNARYITWGSECFYFLVPPPRNPDAGFPLPKDREIRGVKIHFDSEDITPLPEVEEDGQ